MNPFEYDPIVAAQLGGMRSVRHKVFISYHHAEDQAYKDALMRYGEGAGVFISKSVGEGDIDPENKPETIRRTIRDEHLKDSTVTIVLAGRETRKRKHVDWEIYSSMYDGPVNKKNGIAVITLPSAGGAEYYPDTESAIRDFGVARESIVPMTQVDYWALGPRLERNLVEGRIWVLRWERFEQEPERVKRLVEKAWAGREYAKYDMSLHPMRYNRS